MDRQSTLLQLAHKLSAATAAADWPALAAIDALVSNALPALAAQGRWTPAERAALDALRRQHRAALAKVSSATDETGKHLHEMQNNREGYIAYAVDNDNVVTGTEA